jgi:hypothetical protein
VGLGKVQDVDVIADAGAVGGRIVGAVHVDGLAASGGDFQGERDQEVSASCHSPMVPDTSAGRVEVAEGDGAQPVSPIGVRRDLLDHQLAGAVGVDRPLGMVLRDGRRLGQAVRRAGRREDQPFHVALDLALSRLIVPPTLLAQ